MTRIDTFILSVMPPDIIRIQISDHSCHLKRQSGTSAAVYLAHEISHCEEKLCTKQGDIKNLDVQILA